VVEVLDETHRFPHVESLSGTLEELMGELGLSGRDLTVVLTNDDSLRRLNREHRDEDNATDVLSYPTSEPDDRGIPTVSHLGDILISVDTAGRQAAEHGHDLLSETLVLAAHGLTHLRGFDHPTEASWEIFRETQRRALALKAS
jgi:probable rRNA maturation factor